LRLAESVMTGWARRNKKAGEYNGPRLFHRAEGKSIAPPRRKALSIESIGVPTQIKTP
jgi:hypothetical protein